MGNASISNNKKIIASKKNNKRIIVNNQLNHNRNITSKNKFNLDNKNKKGDLDLFKNLSNDSNELDEFNEITKIKKENNTKILTKNYFINDENNINFLKMINNNPITKIKNEMKKTINSNQNNENNLINFTLKDNSFNNDINNGNNCPDIKKKNQNLFEFEANNFKYFHYNEEKKENLKNSPNFLKNEEILTSERTINNTNSEGEFLFENFNNKKNDKNKNKNKKRNKNNIFSNITKYELKKNSNNISSKGKLITNLKNYKNKKKNDNKNDNNNKIKVKIDKIKYNNIKYRKIKAKSKQDTRNNNSIIRINNTNHNNLLLISSFLTNNNPQSKNKINKSHSSYRNNNSYNIKKYNNNNYKNYSFKNLSNNNIIKNTNKISNINTYKENDKLKLNKDKDKYNSYNINSNSNKNSSNNFSYNYNNFFISNETDKNLYEKQKMAELIEKITNNELKNEIKNLYPKIINYNNEIIINNKNSCFDYIITFSNNYIKIKENTFIKKEFNKDNFYIKNQIKISLLSKKNKSRNISQIKYDSKKNKIINLISNITNNSKEKNNSKKLKSKKNINNLILNNIDNESIFKNYTFEQYKKSGNTKRNSTKTNLEYNSTDTNSKIKSKYTVNYSNLKNEMNKIKINKVEKTWKKIINLSEVTINKDKTFNFTILEKSNSNIKKKNLININEKTNNSITCIKNKKENNFLNKEKISKNINIFNNKENFYDFNKFEKFYKFSLGSEKMIFQKNMKKLINVNNLVKDLKKYPKNYIFKEEDLIIFNVICFLSKDYIIIFKDKEKDYPLFKQKIDLMKKIMSFRKNRKFIIIIEFNYLNEDSGIKYYKEDKDKYLGLLIDKENNYNEFIDILTQLAPNLEIIFLN